MVTDRSPEARLNDDHECQFPEEMTPEGVRVLYPCLLCGVAAADALLQMKQTTWTCRARQTADPPQGCNWPFCGCDPHADKVIAALRESGHLCDMEQIIERMRNERSRYKSHDLGFVDSVSATSVDEWADEIEAHLGQLRGAVMKEKSGD